MARLCPSCKTSTQFKVKLVAPSVVDLVNDAYDVIEQGELGVTGSLICKDCNHEVADDEQLIAAMECPECAKLQPIEIMLQLQEADGSDGPIICQPCYDKSMEPSLEEMDKEQLVEVAKNQQAEVDALKEQMAQMQAMMQQLMAQQTAKPDAAPAAKPATEKKATKPATAPKKEEPKVETNIPAPASKAEEVKAPEDLTPVEVIDPTAVAPEEAVDPMAIFGGEAPF